jgi:hypothetical protein
VKCPADRDFADFIVEYLTDPLVCPKQCSTAIGVAFGDRTTFD